MPCCFVLKLKTNQQKILHRPDWREALAHKDTWAVVVCRFFIDPIWWLFVNWLPIYLAERFGFNVKEIGMFAWVPFLGAAAGVLTFSTWLVPALTKISYVPVFLLGAVLVPVGVGLLVFLSGEIKRKDI